MNRRALMVAAVVAVLGVLLLLLYQKRFEDEKSGGAKVTLLSLKKSIERGAVLTDDMLAERRVPEAYTEARAVRATDKSRILGLKVAGKINVQETLLWTDIVTSGDDHQDLSTTLSPNMRAKTLRVSRVDTSIGLIRPGDVVDVIAILGPANSDSRTAVVLLQSIMVSAVGSQMSNDALDRRDTSTEDSITVSVTLAQAQLLDLAADRGHLSVALRRRDDTGVAGVADLKSESLLAPTARAAQGPAAPTSKEIDISGNKR